MPLQRQDLMQPSRESSRERRRALLEQGHGESELPDHELAVFLLEQEIQPTVGHEPRQVVKVRMR